MNNLIYIGIIILLIIVTIYIFISKSKEVDDETKKLNNYISSNVDNDCSEKDLEISKKDLKINELQEEILKHSYNSLDFMEKIVTSEKEALDEISS